MGERSSPADRPLAGPRRVQSAPGSGRTGSGRVGSPAGGSNADPTARGAGATPPAEGAADSFAVAAGPLFGRTIVVTRAVDRSGRLVRLLGRLGATAVEVPVIETVEPADGGAALRSAAARAADYDWIVVASPVAATRFVACQPVLTGVKIAAVGPATAEMLPRTDLIPDRTDADGLVAAFPQGPGRVLLPRAAEGREELVVGLATKGWTVDVVEAYRTVPVDDPLGRLAPGVRAAVATADAITFLSPSAVRAWDGPVPPIVVCMGPTTSTAASARGLRVTAVADPSTLEGVAAALFEALVGPAE